MRIDPSRLSTREYSCVYNLDPCSNIMIIIRIHGLHEFEVIRESVKDVRGPKEAQDRARARGDLRAARVLHQILRNAAALRRFGGQLLQVERGGALDGNFGASRAFPGPDRVRTRSQRSLVAAHRGVSALRGDLSLAHAEFLIDNQEHFVGSVFHAPLRYRQLGVRGYFYIFKEIFILLLILIVVVVILFIVIVVIVADNPLLPSLLVFAATAADGRPKVKGNGWQQGSGEKRPGCCRVAGDRPHRQPPHAFLSVRLSSSKRHFLSIIPLFLSRTNR